MRVSQEPAHRFRLRDTIRQILVSKRFDSGRHNSGIEVWKLMRVLGDMRTAGVRKMSTKVGRSSGQELHLCGCGHWQPDTEQ